MALYGVAMFAGKLTKDAAGAGGVIWRGFANKLNPNQVRPGVRDVEGLSFNVTEEGAMRQSGKPRAAPFDADAMRQSGNWAIGEPDVDGHVNVRRALDVEQVEWYNYYNSDSGPWKTTPDSPDNTQARMTDSDDCVSNIAWNEPERQVCHQRRR